jgi:hypothetical protein
MSLAIDAATKVHQKQIDAVTRSQDLAVSAVEKIASAVQGLQAKSPSVPGSVAGPLEGVTAPVTKVVGTRSEVVSYLGRTVRDWAETQQKLHAAVLGALVSDDRTAPAAKKPAKQTAKQAKA